MTTPLILLSNDDGYDSGGLIALRNALAEIGEVFVCAPRTNQSASSHALTLSSVLRVLRIDDRTFAVDGTPADCVYVALHSPLGKILPRRPDIVVSGMNHGPNLGVDVTYSGTVAAAREAAHRGIPAVAVSADNRANRPAAAAVGARVVARLWQRMQREPMAPSPLLNVNIPAGERWPLVPTRVGRRLYNDEVIYRNDPRGREYLWIGGTKVEHDLTEGTDTWAWDSGKASVTPLSLDLTSTSHISLSAEVAD